MTAQMLVVDLETTGLHGIRAGDEIVEVSIASVDFLRQTVTPIFTSMVHHEKLTPEQEASFIFREGYMEPNDVYDAPFEEDKVAAVLANILEGEYVTSYNTEFDIDRFMLPWFDRVIPEMEDLLFFRAPCIMRAAVQVEDIPRKSHDIGCYPSLSSSYYTLCGDYRDQLRPHHAQDDCLMAGRVLLALNELCLYDPDREDEYSEEDC